MSRERGKKVLYYSCVGIVGCSILAAMIIPPVVNGYGKPIPKASAKIDNTPTEKIVTEYKTESIKYTSTTIEDDTLEYGTTAVRTKGQYGIKTYTYEVVYKDSEKISETLTNEEITKNPVNEVIAKGTKIIWRCKDVTSYDRNPYNDNYCVSSTGEEIYTYDSYAESLDQTYYASKRGAARYNF